MVNFGVSSTLASLPYLASDPGVSRLNVLGAHLPGYRSFIPLRRGGGGPPQSGFVCLGGPTPFKITGTGSLISFDGEGGLSSAISGLCVQQTKGPFAA